MLGGDGGGQRGQALARHLATGDLGVPVGGALLGMPVDRAQQRIDVDERPFLDTGQQSAVLDSPTRCARAADANFAVHPWVNSRKNCPNVADAYTPSNNPGIPPERIASRSSMKSTPAAIPAMTEVSFPAGFTPAERTVVVLNLTRSPINSERPARSASAITGTSPAHDTSEPSSNSDVARDQPSGGFTISAFSDVLNPDFDNPDSSGLEGTSS